MRTHARTHTHTHTHTYSSIYFPPLFRFTGIILSSQRWFTPLSSCHTIQFKTIVSYPQCARHWLRVIRSRGHLRAESSWTLPFHAQYLTDHKMPSFLPLKYHPSITSSTSLLSSHTPSGLHHFLPRKMQSPDVSSCLQPHPLPHSRSQRSDHELMMFCIIYRKWPQRQTLTWRALHSLAPHYLYDPSFSEHLSSPLPPSYLPQQQLSLIHYS